MNENTFQVYKQEWQLTLFSSYNLTRVGFYLVCILFFPYLIIKSEGGIQKTICIGAYIFVIAFGAMKILPAFKRILYSLNLSNQEKDFLLVNQNRVVIPLNYLRPYNYKANNELLFIPLDSISKVNYMDKVAKGQECHVSIKFTIPSGEEKDLTLYSSEFINGQKDTDALFNFLKDKVLTERMEFFR